MPERWERELRKLRALGPREQLVRERVERGPSGSGRPGGRERVIAGLVATAVFIAAAAFAREAFLVTSADRDHSAGEVGSLDLPPLTISAHAEPGQSSPPEASARYGDVHAVIPVQGGEGWGMGNAFPAAMFGPHDAAIPVGAPLLIESDADQLEVGFNRTYPEGDLIPQAIDPGSILTLPSKPGQMLVHLSATWPDGRAEFSIFFDLYEPVDVLDVDCRDHRAPVWRSRVVRAYPDGIHATFQADVSRDLRIDAPGFRSGVLATLEPGETVLELPIPPGIATIGCNNAPDSQITVVDPEGLWAPAQLGCPRGDEAVSVAAESDDRMIDEGAIVERLLTVRSSDEVLPPGYPDAVRGQPLPSRVVVRRDGEIVAKLDVWLGRPVRIEGTACTSAGIRTKESAGPATSPGSSPTASEVLEIRCVEGRPEVLTPLVTARADGVHAAVETDANAAWVEFIKVESPNGGFGFPVDDSIQVWPIEPGEFFVECLGGPSDMYQGLETARFVVVDPSEYWMPDAPECGEGDDLLRVGAYDGGGAHYVDDETAIRALLHSIEPMDEVRLPFYPEGGGAKDLRYLVVRDDRVIATLFVGVSDDEDPYGSGLTEVTGQACASSGIAQGSLG